MEIISKISKGSKMDQVYIPKNRSGFSIGSYVVLQPLETKKIIEKPYFYNIKSIEPIKLELINEIFSVIDVKINYENVIITGSFLDEGFNFKDVDILIISEDKLNEKDIQKQILEKLKIETHIIIMNKKTFGISLSIDPIWRIMISNCISRKRLIPFPNKKINYKYLDAQSIRSKLLVTSFDYLTGKEKYKLTRNLIAIYLFIKNKKLSKNNIEKEIEKKFNIEVDDIKNNLTDKNFLKKYKNFYNKFEKKIIENASKQEKTN